MRPTASQDYHIKRISVAKETSGSSSSHWKDAILLLRYGLVDLARTAGMLRVRLPLQIENLRIETEHEVAHKGLVAFQAIVLAEAAGAVALKH